MAQYLDFTGLQLLWNRIKQYAKIITTSGTTKVVIGGSEVTIPSGVSPYEDTPAVNSGDGSAGNSTLFAKGDHVHPTDTTRAPVSTTVTNVAYDSTNKKITKTINGTTSDVVAVSTLKSELNFTKGDLGLGNVENKSSATIRGEITSTNVTTALGYTPVNAATINAASGICPLDENQKVPAANLPSYVDDVVEAYPRAGQTALSTTWLATGSASGSVIQPESGVIYILMTGTDDYPQYSEFRYGGTTYVKINDGGLSPLSESQINTATPLN